jgi:helicase
MINLEMMGIKENELEDYDIIEKYLTYKVLLDWVNEVDEQVIYERYNILPGILHNKLNIAEWMAYSLFVLYDLLKHKSLDKAKKLQKRIKYGIKEELLSLVELPNVGRVRARKLVLNGITSITRLKTTSPEILANILGLKTAIKILNHLQISHNLKVKKSITQKTLF